MRRVPWNSCTTYAAIGSALAYALLIPAFGLYWQLIPGGIAGLVTAYLVSTSLGMWLGTINIGRYRAHAIIAGIGAALTTLFAGALAIATSNLLVQLAIDVVHSPSGQAFWNAVGESVTSNGRELLFQPILAGLFYGQLPALILGVAYGATLPTVDADTSAASARIYGTSGSSALLALLFIATTKVLIDDPRNRSHVPDGVPVAISGCGSAPVADGVLGYCPGSPCEQGFCQWDTKVDAIAVFVRPPQNGGWKWTGGGIGNTTSPHIVGHNMHWVRPGPDGFFDESSPQRYARYVFSFDADNVRIKNDTFEFEPGMLLVIQYADDWSFTVRVGADSLLSTEVSIDQLQQKLDEVCALFGRCERSFQIAR